MSLEKEKIYQMAQEWEVIWKRRPFENNNGLGCQGAFALYYFLKEMSPAPEVVIECGTWRGFSTWVIHEALPNAKIICSDPILASRQFLNQSVFQPEYRLSDVDYTWQDFSNIEINIPEGMAEKIVIFFDDHQNKIPRIQQAAMKGIRHIIFDDNVPFDYSHETLENIFKKYPERKTSITEQFSRYEIFPPIFKAKTRDNVLLKGLLEEANKEELDSIYKSKEVYSWVTKVELY